MAKADEDRERDPDGRYAPEPKEAKKKKRVYGKPFKKGHHIGRPKGSKNKATLEWKAFALQMSNDPEVQEALKKRILNRPELLLRLAEHAVGKPKESQEVEHSGEIIFRWEGE